MGDPMVPALRFKEFKGEWFSKPFKGVSSFYNGKAYKREELLNTGKYPVLRVGNLFSNNEWYYSDLELDQNKYLDNGDLIYAWSASFGPRIWIGERVIYHYHIWKVVHKTEVIDKIFYFLVLENETQKMKNRSSNGFALLHITKKTIENWQANFPSLPEQQKIADFLSSVDKKIEQLTRKKELLEKYKVGMMQKLFPKAGEQHPELRFKDENGQYYPDWEVKKLGSISDVRDGTHDSPKYVESGYPLVTSKNLGSDGKLDLEKISYITYHDFTTINKRSKVDIGDILFGMIGTIGNPIIVESDDFAIKNVALIKEKTLLINKYLIFNLSSVFIQKQFHEQNAGGTQKFIALGLIRNLQIKLPSISEQQKIADFLSAIDIKITKVVGKLTKVQTFKKGLLQQMFV